jgi:hypothetical protein
MKRRAWFLAVGVVGLAAWALLVAGAKYRTRRAADACLGHMLQMHSAAMSACLERNVSWATEVVPTWYAGYLRDGKLPCCPLGDKPYAPFSVNRGPRCPNSAEHSQAYVVHSCTCELASLWDASISYAASNKLGWQAVIDPSASGLQSYLGKWTGVCPLGTNAFRPFVLAEGPVCPDAPLEHAVRLAPGWPWRNRIFFDGAGRVNTNIPLSRASRWEY